MALPTYSSRDLQAAFGGQSLEGFAPDSSVTLVRNSDITDEEVGSDGQTMISVMADRSGTATLSFQQASISNAILSGVLEFQRANNTIIKANLTIISPDGSVLAFMRNAHIKTSPEFSYGNTATGSTRDWVFYAEEMIFTSTPDGVLLPDEAARIASGVDTIVSNI